MQIIKSMRFPMLNDENGLTDSQMDDLMFEVARRFFPRLTRSEYESENKRLDIAIDDVRLVFRELIDLICP